MMLIVWVIWINLEGLFSNVLLNNLSISKDRINEINRIVESNGNIFNANYIKGANRLISYITYYLKEICEFINHKVNGFYVTELDIMLKQIIKLKEKIAFIKNKI